MIVPLLIFIAIVMVAVYLSYRILKYARTTYKRRATLNRLERDPELREEVKEWLNDNKIISIAPLVSCLFVLSFLGICT